MPKIAYIIGALALIWFIVRLYTRRLEERRQAEREARMERLFAEREEILRRRDEEAPHSLQAVVSDSNPPSRAPAREKDKDQDKNKSEATEPAAIKVRCKSCRALNDESATECASCGKPL